METARIITFGYDGDIDGLNQNGIMQHADNLLLGLRFIRKKPTQRKRPIVFVVHSTGGIIVKQALDQSGQDIGIKDAVGLIYQCTHGIVFLGTPHRGINSNALAATLQKIVLSQRPKLQNSILNEIQRNSPTLLNISTSFGRMLHSGDLRIFSYFPSSKS